MCFIYDDLIKCLVCFFKRLLKPAVMSGSKNQCELKSVLAVLACAAFFQMIIYFSETKDCFLTEIRLASEPKVPGTGQYLSKTFLLHDTMSSGFR